MNKLILIDSLEINYLFTCLSRVAQSTRISVHRQACTAIRPVGPIVDHHCIVTGNGPIFKIIWYSSIDICRIMAKNNALNKENADRTAREGSKRYKYTNEAMQNAVDAVKRRGLTIRASTTAFKDPRVTFGAILKPTVSFKRILGGKTVFGEEIEAKIVHCVLDLVNAGFSITRIQLIENKTN